jgi:GNAT superfamily N-acetyltransferase
MTDAAKERAMSWEIKFADTEAEVRRCWPVFRELRENIATEQEFIARWSRQVPEGYRIVYLESDGVVSAVGGYRLQNNLAWGRFIYLDDLAALTGKRGNGLGAAILRFVQEEATRSGCEAVHLDTGYHRRRAHRTYLRNGFELNSHHLTWRVTEQ